MKRHLTSDNLTLRYPCEPIYGIAALSRALGVREIRLQHVAKMANSLYRVAREEVKADGTKRQTFDAMPLLKAIQIRIKERILARVLCPFYLNGALKGRSTRTNAERHIGAKILFEEDIANFFPSISGELVHRMWSGMFGFSDDVCALLTCLTVKDGGVPQGAPTSSHLANFIFWSHEPDMVRRLAQRGLAYTRFVDDISVTSKKRISPEDKTLVISELYGMLRKHSLTPKLAKHKISSAKGRMTATKLVINERVALPQERRHNLRAAVHNLEQRVSFNPNDPGLLKELNSVSVKVGQLRGYHRAEGEKLRDRLRGIRSRLTAPRKVVNTQKGQLIARIIPTVPEFTTPPWVDSPDAETKTGVKVSNRPPWE